MRLALRIVRAPQSRRHISHLQLQSGVRDVIRFSLARVFAVMESIYISSKHMRIKAYGHASVDRWFFFVGNAICRCSLQVNFANVGSLSQDNSGDSIECSCVFLRRKRCGCGKAWMERLSAMSRVHHCQVCGRQEASKANFRCRFGKCCPLNNFVCLDNKEQFLCERDVEHAKVVKMKNGAQN